MKQWASNSGWIPWRKILVLKLLLSSTINSCQYTWSKLYLLLTTIVFFFGHYQVQLSFFPKDGYYCNLLQTEDCVFMCLVVTLEQRNFSKLQIKINSLISMALLYSKYGTCYFIKLILTFIINFRLFVKHYQHIHSRRQLTGNIYEKVMSIVSLAS